MRRSLFGFFLVLTISTYGQLTEVRRVTQVLCSSEMHGRGYVQKGDSLASVFIAGEFQRIGLTPLKGSWFQEFSHNVNTFPGAMEISIGDRKLKPGVDFIVDAASAGTKATLKPKRISVELALNPDLLVPELRSIIQGREFNAVALDFAGLSADTLKKVRGLAEELAGLIPVIEITSEKFTWSVSNRQLKYPLIRLKEGNWVEGQMISAEILALRIENYRSRNVVAYLPARKRSKRTIVYTAHYDHLGRMGANTYFPGANDNASGTAMLISMAKYFKENPQDYNILFIAFAGEEAGLLGSKYFVENPLFKLKKISFLLNLDIMGSGEEGVTVVNATLFEKEFKLLQEINTEKNLLTQVKSRGPAANSDHYWFTQKGVPAFFIYTMGPNKHYHDIFDTYEELSFQEYEDITTLLVEFGTRL